MLFALVTASMLLLTANAEESLFEKTNEYSGNFSDISADDWFYDDVVFVYEHGIMQGNGELFEPEAGVTAAEAVTIASRLNAVSVGASIGESDGEWYQAYAEYAKANGIADISEFDSPDALISRGDMAVMLVNSLSGSYYSAINSVTDIPDISGTHPAYRSVKKLMNAGIVTGNDIYGGFAPASDIGRAEIAAMVTRIACPEKRKSVTLVPVEKEKQAYIISDNIQYNNLTTGIASGWSFDNRGGEPKDSVNLAYKIADVSETLPVRLIRSFDAETDGKLTVRTKVAFLRGFDGAELILADAAGNAVYRLFTEDGTFYAENADGTATSVYTPDVTFASFDFTICADLDSLTAETSVDGCTPAVSTLKANDGITRFSIGSSDKAALNLVPARTVISSNYNAYEIFAFSPSGVLPYGWESEASSGTKIYTNTADLIFVTPASGGNGSVSFAFEKTGQRSVADILFYTDNSSADFSLIFKDGDKTAVEISGDGETLYANGESLGGYSPGVMWYDLRLIVNAYANTAEVRLNGKYVTSVSLKDSGISGIDGFEAKMESSVKSVLRFDELAVFPYTMPEDYVPEPEIPETEDNYSIGINMCSLWRNDGVHTYGGWGAISPFEEIKPVAGFYTEGEPEYADLEIKQMAEHGIDFQMYCYFASESNAAFKKSNMSEALHDGYFNAVYSDDVSFGLLWEAQNGAVPASLAAFKKYYIPYFISYYFSDSRYAEVDNKAVMAVFGLDRLITALGGESQTKEAFDLLREEVKKCGYDDLILLCCSQTPVKTAAASGFDGCYAYNFGASGSDADFTINKLAENLESTVIHYVPTVSTGFNNVAWAGTRRENMSVEDFDRVNKWVRDTALPSVEAEDGESWKSKLVMYSNWNEYGEGTYIAPTGLCGYGYLDSIRDTFLLSDEHKDYYPDEAVKARIGKMYPQSMVYLAPLARESHESSSAVSLTINGTAADLEIPVVNDGGTVYIPFNPRDAVDLKLNIYYEWNASSKTLSLYANGGSAVFEIGNSSAVINGSDSALSGTPYLWDGIPMIPADALCDAFGYKLSVSDSAVGIDTPFAVSDTGTDDDAEEFLWEFSNDGNAEGWDKTMPKGLSAEVFDGAYNAVCTLPDSILWSPAIDADASVYKTVEIKIKHSYSGAQPGNISLYFVTSASPSWDENKHMSQPVDTACAGEYQVYTFDMSTNTSWEGTITKLRIDPMSPTGAISIDYIKLVADEEAKQIAENGGINIVNGNAESPTVGFFSHNADISIIEEPGNEENHVYMVNARSGKNYVYFSQGIKLTPGKTYKFSLRIKLTGLNTGETEIDKAGVYMNIIYQDTDSNHLTKLGPIGTADGWVTCTANVTVSESSTDRSKDQFSIYTNPVGSSSVNFMIDDVSAVLVDG